MISRKEVLRFPALLLTFAGVALAASCGGGGGPGPIIPPGLVAQFVGSSPTPPDASISMQKGNESGDQFQVKIVAKGLSDVYKAEFAVTYDPAVVTYVTKIDTGSFLRDGGVQTSFAVTPTAGSVGVVATRLPDPPATSITFTPTSPSPGAGTMTMQPGNVTGDTFQVRITATNINDFFGTAFHVTYNPAQVAYLSADDSGSFLRSGATTRFQYQSSPGDLAVVATRLQNPAGNVPGVNVVGSQDVLVLNFRVLGNVSGNAFAFGNPREVVNSGNAPNNQISTAFSGGTLSAAIPTGVNVTAARDLIVLVFRATAATAGTPLAFAGSPRAVTSGANTPVSVSGGWLGGTATAQ